MSLTPENIRQHSNTILTSRRILNRLVVLCEGTTSHSYGRPSPQAYKEMEKMPDANFYNACVPKWWKELRPQFFNCGDREDVINTYFSLLELHENNPSSSYLEPTKLFAIVDLDLQVRSIPNYHFSDTEAVFHNLYKESKVNETNALQHRIWVTGLIHKEAYFLLPKIQEVFDRFPIQIVYKNKYLLLKDLYLDIANEMINDIDLQSNFQRACNRICHCSGLDITGVSMLKDSWICQFQNSQDVARREELAIILLTIRKAKKYWNQIQPSGEWSRSTSAFKDQLLLEIGRLYSDQDDTSPDHLPSFFKSLYTFT